MNTVEYYLQCPYRLEIIPDVDEGDMSQVILN